MINIFTDGAVEFKNPGRIGIGVVIYDNEKGIVKKYSRVGQVQTSNFAEYVALIVALEEAEKLGYKKISLYSDSQLMVRQIQGLYEVSHPNILPLYKIAKSLLEEFEYTIQHISRTENYVADELSKQFTNGEW